MNKRRSKNKKIKKSKIKKSKIKQKKRGFGSESVYGLQGGNLSYSGVYPMEMSYKGTTPNLYNVKRSFYAQ